MTLVGGARRRLVRQSHQHHGHDDGALRAIPDDLKVT